MDTRKSGSGVVSIVIWLFAVAASAGCASAPAPAPAPPPGPVGALPPATLGCDLSSRSFRQTSPGPCGASDWRFTLQHDGSWQANETGCANATGVARYDGATVTLDFQYGGGTGRYTWPLDGHCMGDPGHVTWFTGPLTGQIIDSTLAIAK
jgi:hypothetical protein